MAHQMAKQQLHHQASLLGTFSSAKQNCNQEQDLTNKNPTKERKRKQIERGKEKQ